LVGFPVGINDGGSVGSREGDLVGKNVTAKDGILVGAMDGELVELVGDNVVVIVTTGGGAIGDIEEESAADCEILLRIGYTLHKNLETYQLGYSIFLDSPQTMTEAIEGVAL
jgi:hypothetical protein